MGKTSRVQGSKTKKIKSGNIIMQKVESPRISDISGSCKNFVTPETPLLLSTVLAVRIRLFYGSKNFIIVSSNIFFINLWWNYLAENLFT